MQRDYLPTHEWMVHRPRMAEVLEKAVKQSLVSIVAPPGYGKTLAVADFCRQAQRRVLWLRFSKLDNVEERFWRTFIYSAGFELPQLAEKLESMPFPITPQELDTFLLVFSETLKGGGIVLVLDNLENLENMAILAFITTLVEIEMNGLCIILVSNRRFTDMPAIGGGKQQYIGAAELQFTVEEARLLAEQCGLAFSKPRLEKIVGQAVGWPLALNLSFNHAKQTGTDSFDDAIPHQVIAEMFERNYFANFDLSMRRLLVKLSLLPSASLELIRALGVEVTEDMLLSLSLNIFINYDYNKQIYTFQQTYGEFLSLKQGLISADRIYQLMEIAGQWYLQNGQPRNALICFWKNRDYDSYMRAVAAMPKERASLEVTNEILQQLNEFPLEYRAGNIYVDYSRAFMYLNNMQVKRAQQLFLEVRDRLEGEPLDDEKKLLLGDLYSALADISSIIGTTEGLAYVKKAAELLPGGGRLRSKEMLVIENNECFFLPDNKPGRLEEMIAYQFEYSKYADIVSNGSGAGVDLLFAAEAYFFSGNMDKAVEYAQRAQYKAKTEEQHDVVCNALVIKMRVCVFNGDGDGALAAMKEIDNYVEGVGIPALNDMRDFVKNWMYMRIGYLDKVDTKVTNFIKRSKITPMAVGRDRIIVAYYYMFHHQYDKALATVVELDEVFAEKGLWMVRLHTHLTKTTCYLMTGRHEQAMAEFWAAYDMTHQNNIWVPFADTGKDMLNTLDAAEKQDKYHFDPAWLKMIREESTSSARRTFGMMKSLRGKKPAGKARGFALSPREAEVLQYLADGLSRDEIGSLMGITVHGVKKHIANIYTKLGAVNRVDAIHIAMANGILNL